MAVKHVKEYYEKVCKQYIEMRDNLKEMEELLADDIISPERIENLKKITEPIKENYERWSYLMYLLHLPQRKEKLKSYEKRNKKFLESLNKQSAPDSLLEEGQNINEDLKKNQNF